ncbi:hypothetical protein [Lysobacter enzymogenes]|uniref:hypothetical protein n=1 Tax=Lysobacter enzymogenes TaxID=69 RepID=UPI001AF2D259|nr:hypothetical protein [Lysobacter enzymogenes]QQQ03463.1 hypothetical protein JHW41_11215 [Lysobacter enzymogenes]
MSDSFSVLGVVAIALLPVAVTAFFGYRYGYRQQVSAFGCFWRAVVLATLLSWSLLGGSSHDAAWGLFLPNVVVIALAGFAGADYAVPPLWVAPLAHLIVFALAVKYGYQSKEREYSKFPSQ